MDDLFVALLILVFSLLLHLLEEIRQGFRVRFPLGEMPRGLFVGINLAIYAYAGLMLFWSFNGDPRAHALAWIFAVAMGINAVGHLGIMLIRRAYFPGGWSALLLLATSVNVLSVLLR
jgi:Mg/Co/Ni transporter MgtE